MKNSIIVIIAATFFANTSAYSQNKVLMLNGKTKEIKSYEVKGDWLYYTSIDDPKEKTKKMDKFNVFSVTKADGTEEVIYDPDTSLDGDPTVEQVRNYIKGEQYGMAAYKTP